jgi:hypothetical protein
VEGKNNYHVGDMETGNSLVVMYILLGV